MVTVTLPEPRVLQWDVEYRHMRRCRWSCVYCSLLAAGLNEQGVDPRDYYENMVRTYYGKRFERVFNHLRNARNQIGGRIGHHVSLTSFHTK